MSSEWALTGMPVLKHRLLLYLPLLVLLPKQRLRNLKGTWFGRTITTNLSLLLVVGTKLRTPWRLYWPPVAGITDFNLNTDESSSWKLEALPRDLPTPEDAKQAAGITMAEAVEVS